MNPGPKPPSYISIALMLIFGVGHLFLSWVALSDPKMAAKLNPGTPIYARAVFGLVIGAALFAGSIAMVARKRVGFWAAGIGMICMAGLKVSALTADTSWKQYLYIASCIYIAWETLHVVWKRSPKPGHPLTQHLDALRANPQTAWLADQLTRVATSTRPSGAGDRTPPPPKTLAHLDVGDFAPLSPEELKRRAQKADRSTLFRFGLRNQIPPVTDERTLLIDKALVAHGILTPERLVEIHETGEQWQKLRPTLQNIATTEQVAADRALQQDAADRAATREQKKAEAAAKRARHAAAVAQRKATDIVFLGRGVSGGLSDRRANIERLTALGLPVLTSPAEIAQALGCSIPQLRWLAWHSEAAAVSHYVRFTIPKKSGGTRELAAPHAHMAAAQRWILINILERLTMREPAHGFVRGRSIMSNAVPHVGRDVVINCDLTDFFPSVTFPRVKGIFESLGYSPAAATVLALICTECPRRVLTHNGQKLHAASGPRALPQGACTSPALSNLAARKLDARLEGLARKQGWTYTRYADDLTFSAKGDAAAHCGGILQAVRRLCREESFEVNEKKTRVQRQNVQQTVTGIVVNKRPNVPRDVYRRVRAILHQAQKTGLAAQNREQHPNFPLHILGMISWVHMANPDKAKKLYRAWEKLGQ